MQIAGRDAEVAQLLEQVQQTEHGLQLDLEHATHIEHTVVLGHRARAAEIGLSVQLRLVGRQAGIKANWPSALGLVVAGGNATANTCRFFPERHICRITQQEGLEAACRPAPPGSLKHEVPC